MRGRASQAERTGAKAPRPGLNAPFMKGTPKRQVLPGNLGGRIGGVEGNKFRKINQVK